MDGRGCRQSGFPNRVEFGGFPRRVHSVSQTGGTGAPSVPSLSAEVQPPRRGRRQVRGSDRLRPAGAPRRRAVFRSALRAAAAGDPRRARAREARAARSRALRDGRGGRPPARAFRSHRGTVPAEGSDLACHASGAWTCAGRRTRVGPARAGRAWAEDARREGERLGRGLAADGRARRVPRPLPSLRLRPSRTPGWNALP